MGRNLSQLTIIQMVDHVENLTLHGLKGNGPLRN